METLYIIGFMGAGKTTLAKRLAKQYQYNLIDLDAYIEQAVKQPLAQYIQTEGIIAFRKKEAQALRSLEDQSIDIISCGGGIIESEANRCYLKTKNVLYLDTPFDVLYHRIQQDTTERPLAMTKTKEELFLLYQQRKIAYNEVATYKISSDLEEEELLQRVKLLLEGS